MNDKAAKSEYWDEWQSEALAGAQAAHGRGVRGARRGGAGLPAAREGG